MTSGYDLDLRWDRLVMITREQLIQKRADQDLAAKYELMLNDLRQNRDTDGQCLLLGLRCAPGSKDRHHDFEGGLVAHLLQMWDLWLALDSPTFDHPKLDNKSIWRAILHHDLNKVWRYRLVDSDPWTVEYAHRRPRALLGSGSHMSLFLLQSYGVTLDLVLYNALLSAEGGYSKIRPDESTALGKLVYLLDELSANVVNRLETNRFWDPKRGGANDEAE